MITIITINYNNKLGLLKTLNSIQMLSNKNDSFELVIIDGGSTDGSLDIIESFKDIIDYSISEKDAGIFDAMNKGMNRSSHDWVIFMNSGDVFSSNFSLSYIPKEWLESDCNLIYGNKIENEKSIKPMNRNFLEYGIIHACHQAMFIRNKYQYDLRYKIYGDYELVSRLYLLGESKFRYLDVDICQREEGGISRAISSRKRYEKYLAVYNVFGFKKLIASLYYRFSVKNEN